MGRGGGGQVVSVLAFYFDDPSLIPAVANSILLNVCLKRTYLNKKRPITKCASSTFSEFWFSNSYEQLHVRLI